MDKIKKATIRKKAVAIPLEAVFTKVNQITRGWINYYRIGDMKIFIRNIFGPWLRHKIRVIILKEWKNPLRIYRNLMKINIMCKCKIPDERIYGIANARQGLYQRANIKEVNYLLSSKVLATPNVKKNRPGLVDPFEYYQNSLLKLKL